MKRCKTVGCGSYALNVKEESGFCDVCYYKIPLLNLLARVHGDGGHYTDEHGVSASVADADVVISNLMMAAEAAVDWWLYKRSRVNKGYLTNPGVGTIRTELHLAVWVDKLIQARREKQNGTK